MGWRDVEKAIKVAAGLDEDILTPSDRLLWFVLAHHRNSETGLCFPSIETLMKETGLSRRSGVQKSIRHLEDAHIISVIQGGGRTPNHYNLLIHHVDKDQVRLVPVDDLDALERVTTQLRGVSEAPQPRSEDAPAALLKPGCSALRTPESGSSITKGIVDLTTSPVRTVPVPNGSKQDQTVAVVENSTQKTEGQIPVFREIPETPSIVPVNAPQAISPLDREAEQLVSLWESKSTKPVFKTDFIRLLEEGATYPDVRSDMIWVFETSNYWASESPNWNSEFGFDLNGSGAFVSNYSRINQSHYNWVTSRNEKIAAAQTKEESSRSETTPDFAVAPKPGWEIEFEQEWAAVKARHREPDPQDVLEEEYISDCDERETVMDMFNPFAEDDAKEAPSEFYPWQEDSRSEATTDCAVAPEEKQDVDFDSNDIEVEDLSVTAKATEQMSLDDDEHF